MGKRPSATIAADAKSRLFASGTVGAHPIEWELAGNTPNTPYTCMKTICAGVVESMSKSRPRLIRIGRTYEKAKTRSEGAARCTRGGQLMHRGDHVHHAAIPDFAYELDSLKSDEVGGSGLDAHLGDEDRACGFGGRLMSENHFLDPRSLASGVDVVSAILSAGGDDGR